MGKPSSRADRQEKMRLRKERRGVEAALRAKKEAAGLTSHWRKAVSNSTCPYRTVAEEQAARADAVLEQAAVIRGRLPVLLRRFARIADPRDPRKIRHKHTVLLVYGVLMFVYQLASRREANRTVTRPAFLQLLKELFPDLESIPHGDTLCRFLERIDVEQLADAHVEMVRHLIRSKKFLRYLVGNCYPVSIDGTQKGKADEPWAEECLERTVGSGDKARPQYYVYVLEASLTFQDGMTIPLMSEFLSNADGDPEKDKQDCELKAFRRLAKRLKAAFPRLPILVLGDGLYPNGPVMELCRENHWQFMLVLQDKSLPSVWEEFDGLKTLQPENVLQRTWGERKQRFRWVNRIEYRYGDHGKKRLILHVVICEETWWEVEKETNRVVGKNARHAWVSSEPLNKGNVHERCNLGARHRWGIEAGFLVEKRHGYGYEHCFAQDWKAMKGYHFLMHMARLLNVLVEFSERVGKIARSMGMGAFLRFVRETIGGRWLDGEEVRRRLGRTYQLRLG